MTLRGELEGEDGQDVQECGDIYIYISPIYLNRERVMIDSHCCTAETNTIL